MALFIDLSIWDGRDSKQLGELEVIRDQMDRGDEIGNYAVKLDGDLIGRIEQYERQWGAWELAKRAIALVPRQS